MIEVGGLPRGRVVAILAGLRETEADVVGVGRPPEIRRVTTHAVRRCSLVLAAHVASQAVETGVRPRQCETSHFQMIEGGAEPGRNRVALLATGRERCRRMAGRIRLLIRRRVTGVALERKTLKLTDRRPLVTTVALQRGMSTDQREPVLVISNGLNGDLPPLHAVTAFTGCAHLPVMNVGVTIPAPRTCVGKDRFRMTLRARHVLVHPEKGVAGLAVIEFRNCAYRFPSENGVAILARNVQVAVGAARCDGAAGLCMREYDHCAGQKSGKSTNREDLGARPTTTPHDATSLARWLHSPCQTDGRFTLPESVVE